jgi:hypothetical protein
MPPRKPTPPARRPTPPIDEQIRRDDLKRIKQARRLEKTIRSEARALLRDIKSSDLAIGALDVTVRQRKRERASEPPAMTLDSEKSR